MPDLSLRLLVIEPDGHDYLVTKRMLKRSAATKYEFKWADTIYRSLEIVSSGWPDLILLEPHLVDGKGIEALAKLRARSSSTPVIIFSGARYEPNGGEFVRLGAQDFLIKGELDGKGLDRALTFAVLRTGIRASHPSGEPPRHEHNASDQAP